MSDGCCDNEIDVGALRDRQRRVLITVLIINVATFAVMATAAMLSGASSLLSGALDNHGDVITYALSFAVGGAAVAVSILNESFPPI